MPVDNEKVYMPDVSWSRVFAQAIQERDFSGQRVIEVGVGSGLNMAGLMVTENPPAKFTGVDISAVAIATSAELASGRNWEPKVRLVQSDLLDGLSDKRLRKADCIIANLPQIPVHGHEIMNDRQRADYYEETGLPEDKYGLGLLARLLDQAARRAPQAELILNVAGRPGDDAVNDLFAVRGFETKVLHEEIVRQAPDTSVKTLAQREAVMGGGSFSFFEDRKGLRKIDAGWAEKVRSEHIASVYHKLSVIQARLG